MQTQIFTVENGGKRYWMIKGVPHLFKTKEHALNYSQLHPQQTGPWKWQQDRLEAEEHERS